MPQKRNINNIRFQIMQEYNSQKGLNELIFELLNLWYYIYEKEEEKYKKYLTILLAQGRIYNRYRRAMIRK